MEQAINTFEEGLIMDLNPLTTPANVLTNCLNGTLITYNGNEFVLQNDDGNGRVETAYLPSGYVPIGIKEHGGVIYVASYNPLTNKGQVGSFPSPERNISSEESGSPTLNLTPESFGFKYELKNGNKVLNKDGNPISIEGATTAYTKLELLKDTSILRPGDKFAIQFKCKPEDLAQLSTLLENYDNTSSISNKRLIKIRISIADSNGNLVDITEKLKRIEENEILWPRLKRAEETEEEWLRDKYNGYFMQYIEADEFTPSLEDTRRVDKFLNVYNNKIAGTLYLTAELATIDSYEVSVSGVKTEHTVTVEGKETIEEGATINLNTAYTSEILDTYIEQATSTIEDYWYGNKIDLHLESNGEVPEPYVYNVLRIEDGRDLITGKYTNEPLTVNIEGKILNYKGPRIKGEQEIGLNLEQKELAASTGLLTYTVLPNMKYGKLKTYEKSGFIDINLLGTGTVNLNLWQYYTDLKQSKTTIRFGFQAYPEEKEPITAVKFTFYNIKDYKPGEPTKGITKQLLQRVNWHTSCDEIFSLGNEIKSMTLYIVGIEVYGNNREQPKKEWSTFRYLYTTELYNEFYSGKTDIVLKEGETLTDFDTFNPTPLIQLSSGLNINSDNYANREAIETIDKTSVIGKAGKLLYYKYTENWKYIWDYNPKSSITNKSKYPFELNTTNIVTKEIITKHGEVDPDSEVPVGKPTDLPGDIISAGLVNGRLEIVVPTLNNLTGLANTPKTLKGSVLQSYMDESNIINALNWQSTAVTGRLLEAHLSGGKNVMNRREMYMYVKYYTNGNPGGTVEVMVETSSTDSDQKTFVGWKNEGKGNNSVRGNFNFLKILDTIPAEMLVGDIIILNFKYVYWANDIYVENEPTPAILFKNSIGEYVLLNAWGNKLKDNGYNILNSLFKHMLVASSSDKVSVVNTITDPSYWKDYIYNWTVSISTKNTLEADLNKEEHLFKLDTGTSFGKTTITKWIDKLKIPESMKSLTERLDSKPCIEFNIIDESVKLSIVRKEHCPNIDSTVNSYTNPSLDGMIIAIGLDGNPFTETYNGTQLSPNKLYAFINGKIYDSLDTISFDNEEDTLRMRIANALKLNLTNSRKLILETTRNTYNGEYPKTFGTSRTGYKGIWQFATSEYNANHFFELPIYKLDPENLSSLTV